MVIAASNERLTIEEAEAVLGIDRSQIEAWISQGRLPVTTVPTTVLMVDRQALETLVASTQSSSGRSRVGLRYVTNEDELFGTMSKEEIEANLAALRAIDETRERMLAERGGELFPPSWELIRESRDER